MRFYEVKVDFISRESVLGSLSMGGLSLLFVLQSIYVCTSTLVKVLLQDWNKVKVFIVSAKNGKFVMTGTATEFDCHCVRVIFTVS